MTSRNQSESDSLPPGTTYVASTIVPSNTTSSTPSPSAAHQSPDPSENQEGSASRTLASMMHHGRDSEYRIQYFQNGVYNSIKAASNRDGGDSHVEAHDEAMRILVRDLNRTSALDRNDPERDVRAVVEVYNENHNKTLVSVYDAESHSGSRPAWDASISIKSLSVAHRIGKKAAGTISSGTGKAGSVLKRLQKPGWEQL
jgi:hypothetical protein